MSRARSGGFVHAVTALSALALAGCGIGGGGTESAFAAAEEATRSADSMRFTLDSTITADGKTTSYGGQGVADNDALKLSMSMTMPNPVGSRPLAMRGIVDGTTLYLRVPYLQKVVPGIEPWLELDWEAGEVADVDVGALTELGRQSDPLESLDVLRATGDVEVVGTERVRGVETTHYRGAFDLTRYAEILDEEGRPAAAKAIRRVVERSGGTLVLPMDVWIDEDDLVRRQSYELVLAQGSAIRMRWEFFDYGTTVEIEPPPADDVMPFQEYVRLAGG